MTLALPPDEFTAMLPKHVVSAAVLLTDGAGRILMLHQARAYPGHPAWWQLPGGLADAGERPHETATRETREETGLRLPAELPLLAVDYRAPVDGWPPVIDFCFDGGTARPEAVVLLSAEHDDYAWRDPVQWQPCLQPAQRPWFAALLRARAAGTALFLNDGR
ncbi:8-oxo-dGTP pyrophosphatase MutT (NUDIX family) [Kitasatospora sp. GAS204A]|uniref:NUDIX hydrolase n=1 Tax=unclassified Kitasatospora TaxID=2633591 RepID=UPI0024752B33|nr:NUDIX hydrolase [Kitasatospora sp. GAS204B]MDH6120413.1 8-oxo-dGTP pyrophosphatase MutT (NUDIX family) [Kitasatospora sp. GAS204B]